MLWNVKFNLRNRGTKMRHLIWRRIFQDLQAFFCWKCFAKTDFMHRKNKESCFNERTFKMLNAVTEDDFCFQNVRIVRIIRKQCAERKSMLRQLPTRNSTDLRRKLNQSLQSLLKLRTCSLTLSTGTLIAWKAWKKLVTRKKFLKSPGIFFP